MPAITVLIAVYNGEVYLQAALDSVLAQTFADLELIVVNDGSTDHTAAILAACSDPRLRVIANEFNIGLARSLNRGLRAATGRYVARLDADDLAEPARLEAQTTFLDANPDIVLLGSGYRDIDAHGVIQAERRTPVRHVDLCWELLFYSPFAHSAVMLRRKALADLVGGYDETLHYSMDYDLWYRTARVAKLASIARPLVRIRTSPISMTATFGERSREGYRMRVARMSELLDWRVDADESTARFDRLYTFLTATEPELTAPQANSCLADLRRLHGPFCNLFALDRVECASHNRRLERTLAARLRDVASACLARGEVADARRLLSAALRTRPSLLLDPKTLGALAGRAR